MLEHGKGRFCGVGLVELSLIWITNHTIFYTSSLIPNSWKAWVLCSCNCWNLFTWVVAIPLTLTVDTVSKIWSEDLRWLRSVTIHYHRFWGTRFASKMDSNISFYFLSLTDTASKMLSEDLCSLRSVTIHYRRFWGTRSASNINLDWRDFTCRIILTVEQLLAEIHQKLQYYITTSFNPFS